MITKLDMPKEDKMRLTWAVVVSLLVYAHKVHASSQPCQPSCLPPNQKTRSDCLVFQRLSTCKTSRHNSYTREADCACMWMTYIRESRSFHETLDKERGFLCLKWSLSKCDRTIDIGTKTDEEALAELPRLINKAKGIKGGLAEYPDDIGTLIEEISQQVQNFEGGEELADDEGNNIPKTDQKTGVMYGVLNKKAGTLNVAEKLKDKGQLEDLTDMIGPGLGNTNWWFWTMKDDKFKLVVFLVVILFVIFFILLAMKCVAETGGDTKAEKMGGTKGDLDPNMYKMSHDKPGSKSTVGGLSKEEKKWSNVQAFIDKLRAHQQRKETRLNQRELDMYHMNMRRKSYPEDNPSPVQVVGRKMVKMDSHVPSYRTNYQSANATQDSPDDNYDVIYDRTNPTESSFNNTYESINTTYEQPFPVFKKEHSNSDPIYYNAATDKDNYPELSPVIEERSRSEEDEPAEYRNIPADIPSGMGVTERIQVPMRAKAKKSKKSSLVLLPMARVAR